MTKQSENDVSRPDQWSVPVMVLSVIVTAFSMYLLASGIIVYVAEVVP